MTADLQRINEQIDAAEQIRAAEQARAPEQIRATEIRADSQARVNERICTDEQTRTEGLPSQTLSAGPKEPPQRNPNLGNNAICYQGVQRTFRNAIVGFLRERLPKVFPKDHLQRMKQTFGDQWDKDAKNAAQSRDIGGTTTTIRDDYDLLGVGHFYQIFDKFFDKLFSTEAGLQTGTRPVKSKLLGNLKTIKDARDPLSHPVDEEVAYDEAFGVLIDAKQVLAALGFAQQATDLGTLADRLVGGPPEVASVPRHLPTQDSIYREFVGRDGILEELDQCFQNPDNRRCLLAGDGGKGKSAVAYRFAQQLAQIPGRFQLIVWLSAKRRRFQDGSPVAIGSPDFTNAEDAVDRLLVEYGAVERDFQKPLAERKQLLLEYLNSCDGKATSAAALFASESRTQRSQRPQHA